MVFSLPRMRRPMINRTASILLLTAASAARGLAWVLDPTGRRFAPAPVVEPTYTVTHFHIQRHCSYCGASANAMSRCDGCGAPPLFGDASARCATHMIEEQDPWLT
jgi:hypothetical protein